MKRIYLLSLLCLVSVLFTACGTYEDAAYNAETALPSGGIYVTDNPEMITPTFANRPEVVPTASSDTSIEERFVGEYNDCQIDQPNLEIEKMEDGTYKVEIGIYRTYQIDPCQGKLVGDKIKFSSDQVEGEVISGTITIDDQGIATVTFLSEFWKEIDSENTYVYYKISDIPYEHYDEY